MLVAISLWEEGQRPSKARLEHVSRNGERTTLCLVEWWVSKAVAGQLDQDEAREFVLLSQGGRCVAVDDNGRTLWTTAENRIVSDIKVVDFEDDTPSHVIVGYFGKRGAEVVDANGNL